MSIKNTTKSIIISKNARICKNVLSKGFGLMFSRKQTLIFVFRKEKINPLHMLFVFYPIDVLFLDKNKVVVEIKKNFKPFSFYTPNKKSMYIIEIPKNIKEKIKTETGDKIEF